MSITISGSNTGVVQKDSSTEDDGTFSATDTNSSAAVTWSIVGGTTTHAPNYQFAISEFSITSSGLSVFDDPFNSSTPPQYADGTLAQYTQRYGAVTTSGGKDLLLGSSAGSITSTFSGQVEILNANSDAAARLQSGTSFTTSGVFDLVIPTDPLSGYGILLTDGVDGHDVVRLEVIRDGAGQADVQLQQLDNTTGSVVTLQSIALNPASGDDQIELQLSNDGTVNNGQASASFSLLNHGTVDTTKQFTATGSIFVGENGATQTTMLPAFTALAPDTADSILTNSYGTLVLNQAGGWTYGLNNSQQNVQALTQGHTATDVFTIQASDSNGTIATAPLNISIEGNDPTISVTITGNAGSAANGAQSFDQFFGFGDSLLDSGYFFTHPISTNSNAEAQYQASVAAGGGIPTSLGRKMNSTLLAEDYGLTAIPIGEAGGTNYAASGATVNGNLTNSLAPSIGSQIQSYLTSHNNVADPNAIYLVDGGSNDEKIAENRDPAAAQAFMISEAHAFAADLGQLHADGAKYIVYSAVTTQNSLGELFNSTLVNDLAAAGVPFIYADTAKLLASVYGDPSAYGIVNTNRPQTGPFSAAFPYNPAVGGADLPPNSATGSSWSLYATQLQSPNAGQTYLWSDDEHLSAAGQAIEANYIHGLIQANIPTVGEVLTANPTVVNGSGSAFTYQWQIQNAGASTWSNITGATGSTLVVNNSELGDELRVETFFTDTVTGVSRSAFSDPTMAVAACYCAGTLICTTEGECRIENLGIGDQVLTATATSRSIKWIGRRSYGGRFVTGRKDILPICFKAGSLEDNVPKRDLWVSPHHAMYLAGVLIEAKDLVNGVSVVQAQSVVFNNAHEYDTSYPNAVPTPARYYAPRRDHGYEVEEIRQNIATRAGLCAPSVEPQLTLRGYVDRVTPRLISGWAQTIEHPEAPVCLDIYAGGQLIGRTLANKYREDLYIAGLGSGRHSFEFIPPTGLTAALPSLEVRRSFDGQELAPSTGTFDSLQKTKALENCRLSRASVCT